MFSFVNVVVELLARSFHRSGEFRNAIGDRLVEGAVMPLDGAADIRDEIELRVATIINDSGGLRASLQ
jgi:hypothetical protein